MTRIAVAHDWFVNTGGAERVALTLAERFDAPILTALAFPDRTYPELAAREVRTSRLQAAIRDPARFRRALRRYPAAWEGLDATGFDVVLASTSAFAHHVRTDGCLIAYCHQPPRFLYDEAIARRLAPWFARPVLGAVLRRLRAADQRAATRVHRYVANSKATAERIRRIYGQAATVVHPPIDTRRFQIAPRTADHWLVVSRLLPHRDLDLAIDAFGESGRRLIVVGDGPDRGRLERRAGPSVSFAGAIDDDALARLYGESIGVVVPGIEDLGMVALEANASGRPVVARAAGGALETVRDGRTGILFGDVTPSGLVEAVARAEATTFDPIELREHAKRFDRGVFEAAIDEIVEARATCLACQRSGR